MLVLLDFACASCCTAHTTDDRRSHVEQQVCRVCVAVSAMCVCVDEWRVVVVVDRVSYSGRRR